MQCGLVFYRAGQERVAVGFERDGQAPEPVCPFLTQMALDPDLIDQRPAGIRGCVTCARHCPVPCVTLMPTASPGVVVRLHGLPLSASGPPGRFVLRGWTS